MASFRKRGSAWEYRIKYKDPGTGKTREKMKSGFRTKKEAQLAANIEEQKLANGIDLNKQEMLLKDYLNFWFDHFKKGTTTWGTEKNLKNTIEICSKHLGYVKLNQLDREVWQKFINKIAPHFSKSTLQRHNSRLSEAFEQAIDLDYMRKNPAKKVNYPRTVKPIKNPKKNIELEEYLELVTAIEEEWTKEYQHYKYITYALVGSGARVGEICALQLKDVDFENKLLSINKTYVRENRVWKIKDTVKTGESGERVIGIDDFTLNKLKEWKKIRNEIILRHRLQDVELFFINEIGQFIKTVNYGSSLKTICRRNNIRHFTPHMFRHTHETIMWESGVTDINFIGARLGDKDKSILLNTYGHKSTISEQRNMEKINEFMERWAKSGQELLDTLDNR